MTALPLKRRHLVLVTSLLGGGGVERLLLVMAQWWAENGYQITVLVLRKARAVVEYPIPNNVEVKRLPILDENNRISLKAIQNLWHIRRTLLALRPDRVVSFLDKLNVAVLLATLGTPLKVITTDHLAPWCTPLEFPWSLLRRVLYHRAYANVAPTHSISQWLSRETGVHVKTLIYPARLPNVAPRDDLARRQVILAAGRLVPQKGFDMLITAFSKIAQQFPSWTVEVAGEGPERWKLESRVVELGLVGRVVFLGHRINLFSLMRTAEIFVLSSRHEALPNVLIEAMWAGCAALAFDCPTGPREILSPGTGVLIAPNDIDAMSTEMAHLMEAAQIRCEMGERAQMRALEFGPERVMPVWRHLTEDQDVVATSNLV